jgi:hypothetical protein
MRRKCLGGAVLIALGVLLAVHGNAQAKAPRTKAAPGKTAPVLEPKAMDILKASCDRLAAARSMTFMTVISYESPSRLGLPLIYTTKSDVTVQRPDKLRVITPGDGPAGEFYYDGKVMMAFAPAENLVAIADAPPTIDAMLQAAYSAAAIYFPFSDVIVSDPWEGIDDGLTRAFYIGQSQVVGGTTTDMVAIENKWVFEQIWIGADDKLPRMVRAVFLSDPQRLRQQMEFSGWNLNPAVAAEAFASSSAAAAPRIPFARPDIPKLPHLGSGVKPRAKATPAQAK